MTIIGHYLLYTSTKHFDYDWIYGSNNKSHDENLLNNIIAPIFGKNPNKPCHIFFYQEASEAFYLFRYEKKNSRKDSGLRSTLELSGFMLQKDYLEENNLPLYFEHLIEIEKSITSLSDSVSKQLTSENKYKKYQTKEIEIEITNSPTDRPEEEHRLYYSFESDSIFELQYPISLSFADIINKVSIFPIINKHGCYRLIATGVKNDEKLLKLRTVPNNRSWIYSSHKKNVESESIRIIQDLDSMKHVQKDQIEGTHEPVKQVVIIHDSPKDTHEKANSIIKNSEEKSQYTQLDDWCKLWSKRIRPSLEQVQNDKIPQRSNTWIPEDNQVLQIALLIQHHTLPLRNCNEVPLFEYWYSLTRDIIISISLEKGSKFPFEQLIDRLENLFNLTRKSICSNQYGEWCPELDNLYSKLKANLSNEKLTEDLFSGKK